MKTLEATYVWSATVRATVPDNASNEEQRAALDEAAMQAELDFKHPVLHSCEANPELVD